jgi:hypothetical protein
MVTTNRVSQNLATLLRSHKRDIYRLIATDFKDISKIAYEGVKSNEETDEKIELWLDTIRTCAVDYLISYFNNNLNASLDDTKEKFQSLYEEHTYLPTNLSPHPAVNYELSAALGDKAISKTAQIKQVLLNYVIPKVVSYLSDNLKI